METGERENERPSGAGLRGVVVVVLLGVIAMLAGLAFDHDAAGSWIAALGFFTCGAAIFYARFIR